MLKFWALDDYTGLLRAVGGAGSGSDLLRDLLRCGHTIMNTGWIGHDNTGSFKFYNNASIWNYNLSSELVETINKSSQKENSYNSPHIWCANKLFW